MKQFLGTACLTIVALVGLASVTEAGGLFRRNRGCCDTPCEQPCASASVHHVPAPVQYEERKVKVYSNVWKEKEVESVVHRCVPSQEKFTYTVNVQVWNDVKRKVQISTPVCKPVEYTYTIMTPKVMQKTVQVTNYNCVTDHVKEQVPVCRTICVPYVDECGRCCVRRETVTEMREVTRCVVRRVPVVTEQVVNYTVCEPVQHKGTKNVVEFVRSEQEITEKVCSFVPEKREGVRTVYNTVADKVKHMVKYCERVETEQVIRVPVHVPCAAPCETPCMDQGYNGGGHGHGGRSGGLFRRGGGGCCN